MDDLRKAISGDILKATVEKSQTNVASATMNHLRKIIWGDIWKRTLHYVKVSDQSNIAMFWVKKLISQPTVPAEPPFFEQIILTH